MYSENCCGIRMNTCRTICFILLLLFGFSAGAHHREASESGAALANPEQEQVTRNFSQASRPPGESDVITGLPDDSETAGDTDAEDNSEAGQHYQEDKASEGDGANDKEERDRKEKLIQSVTSLLQEEREAKHRVAVHVSKVETLSAEVDAARLSLQADKERYVDQNSHLKVSEAKLHGIQDALPSFEDTLEALNSQAIENGMTAKKLRREANELLSQQRKLEHEFRKRGLQHWVQGSVRGRVGPFLSDAMVEGTEYVLEPMLTGLGRVSTWNTRLSHRLQQRAALPQSPLYTGFVTCLCLLLPTVAVIALLLRVGRRISRIPFRYILILGDCYFGLMVVCFLLASTLGSVDVLVSLRYRSVPLYDLLILLHGILYCAHCAMHLGAVASASHRLYHIIHWLSAVGVGVHFFSNSARHLSIGESPHVELYAYVLYSCVFTAGVSLSVSPVSTKMSHRTALLGHSREVDIDPTGSTLQCMELGGSVTLNIADATDPDKIR